MQSTPEGQRREAPAKVVMRSLFHQFIPILGVPVVAPYAVILCGDLVRIFGVTFYMKDLNWIITGTPYFPAQILLALFLGWLIGCFVRHRSMLWVWVLPLGILIYFVAAFPSIGQIGAPKYAALSSSKRLSHFFGWGCRPKNSCIDQLVTTMPFYSAVAYSLGAWIARKTGPALSFAQLVGSINKKRAALFIGAPCLCVTLASVWIGLSQRNTPRAVPAVCALVVWALAESVVVTFVAVTVTRLIGPRSFLARFFLIASELRHD
jgi:hypothetical protein